MLSAVYQLGTEYNQKDFEKDSGNRLYWRANRHRMTAEQIRDSLLMVSGALELKMGGPSAALTPLSTRRTVYGKVSRYKLDEYLQLFDFPSPNLSAEKRFTTSVPLQRLFFMNSDFMQQQAELLARKVANETDNNARVQKADRLIFGRPATDAEVKAALTFITTEPLKDYAERKAEEEKKKASDEAAAKGGKAGAAAVAKNAPDGRAPDKSATAEKPEKNADGMMSGVVPGAGNKDDEAKLLPVTPWGRYIKVLLSSSEFIFVN
jgi:hypothetical protein